MSKIIIGKADGHNVSIDLETLFTTRMLVTADSGGGKTFALKRIIEQAFEKIQILIIDPEGEFGALREQFGFVLVGKGGETPVDTRSAKLVAQTLLKLRASAICDLYEMKPSERHIWVREFCDGLLDAPKEHRHPCLIIVDECHLFAPEHGKGESVASDAVIGLCTRGRKRLLVPLFATQRLATLSKDASSMLLNRMVGGTFEDVNRKRAAEVLGIAKEKKSMQGFYDEIKTLEPGYFFCLGRAISKERVLVHVGPIETAHGQEALKYEITPPPAPSAIAKLLPKLSDLPKQAEEQARTEEELKKEIRSLKAQLRAAPIATKQVPVADPKAIERAVRAAESAYAPLRALLEEVMKVIIKIEAVGLEDTAIKPEDITKVLDGVATEIATLAKRQLKHRSDEFERLKKETNRLLAKMKRVLGNENVDLNIHMQHNKPFTVSSKASTETAHREPRPRPAVLNNGSGEKLPEGEKEVLIAIARYEEGVERNQLTVLTGYKRSTRDAYIARMKPKGLIEENNGRIVATQTGIDALGAAYTPQPATGDELQEYWMSELPEGERKILQLLIAEQGKLVERESLDEATGFARSSRDAYLSRLGAKRLVESDGRGLVKAADALFA